MRVGPSLGPPFSCPWSNSRELDRGCACLGSRSLGRPGDSVCGVVIAPEAIVVPCYQGKERLLCASLPVDIS